LAAILIAEDDKGVREFVSRALERDGHHIIAVSDGTEALEVLTEGGFDLLLTDIVMPEMDGIALALKVAKDYPKLKVLMMTGYAHEQQRVYNLEILIHDVVPKPFTLQQIREAARQVLDG